MFRIGTAALATGGLYLYLMSTDGTEAAVVLTAAVAFYAVLALALIAD